MKNKKNIAKKTTKHLVTVRVQPIAPTVATPEDLQPVKDGGKFMIPKTWMSERQVVRLVQKTPPQHVFTRPAKGGGVWSYVTGNYVEKVLNFTFGWNWDFEVQSHGREGEQIWVLGKLTVKDDKGHTITKSQFGRADIKFKRNSKEILDYGNDLKAATTDALKKCASLLGIASDIYGKAEFKDIGVDVKDPSSKPVEISAPKQVEIKSGQVIGPDGLPTYVCSKCDDPISDEVANFSMKMHGKRLCKNCQSKK